MRAVAFALVLSVASSIAAAPRPRSVRFRGWGAPSCAAVTNFPNLFFSLDRGRSFGGNNSPAPAASGPSTIAVLEDSPRVMVAAIGDRILDSTDAGCTWAIRYKVEATFSGALQIAPGRNGKVVFWSPEILVAYDRAKNGAAEWRMPETIVALGVDPNDSAHVRAIGTSGQGVWDSRDSGATWLRIGYPVGTTIAAAAVDPANSDHIVIATTAGSVMTSRDGGFTFSLVPDLNVGNNVCQILFSRADPNVVWLLARNNADFLYRSTDGGLHFQPLRLASSIGSSCFRLVSHPRDPNLVAMVAGGFFLIDASVPTITGSQCCGAPIADAAFSPDDVNVVYVFATAR